MATILKLPTRRLVPEPEAKSSADSQRGGPQSLDARGSRHAAPCLTVRGAQHAFGARTVLAGVDLDIRPGEIFGLLGPNGAGKSTLMRAICGRLTLDGGSVEMLGADPRRDKTVRRRIGFVPQDIALYGFLTVRENMQLFARLSGMARADIPEALARGLARTGLTQRADARIDTLSGGYQRRANICAALLHQPTLLVLDEPTVGIDIDAREQIHALLADLRTRGTAILLTTHDLEQAQHLSDRIGILQSGRFVCLGPPAELIQETFAGQSELVCVLGPVDEARAQALKTLGLSPGQLQGTWSCYAPATAIELPLVQRRLQQAGLVVRELRVREPDLSNLFTAALKTGPQSGGAKP